MQFCKKHEKTNKGEQSAATSDMKSMRINVKLQYFFTFDIYGWTKRDEF